MLWEGPERALQGLVRLFTERAPMSISYGLCFGSGRVKEEGLGLFVLPFVFLFLEIFLDFF